MRIREAAAADAPAVAHLHAESWRTAYRGILNDEFLDHQVHPERLALWTERFAEQEFGTQIPKMFVLLAEQDEKPAGFASVFIEDDPIYGSLLDNLHVSPALTRSGIGRQLLSECARQLLTRGSRAGLYLWVIDKNLNAQKFYEKAGATYVDSYEHDMPDGSRVVALRCYWPDPSALIV
jgi:GNAT superfamily N-acetyltransferase